MAVVCFPLDAVSGAPQYTGEMLRQALSVLAGPAPSTRPVGSISGVRPGTLPSTVTASSTTWTVLPHSGILDVETAATAGPYLYAVGANVTGSVTAANATNPRVDIVYVQLSDPAEGDGTSVPQVSVLYLAGTAAATPSAPATPARSMVLAQINVPKSGGGSPSVTWVAPVGRAAPARLVTRSTTIAVLDSTWTIVGGYTAAVYAAGDLSYSSGVVTINVPGLYMVSANVLWPSATATQHRVIANIYQNGSASAVQDTSWRPVGAGGNTLKSITGVLNCSAGDTLSLALYQDSTTTINATPSQFSVSRIGP